MSVKTREYSIDYNMDEASVTKAAVPVQPEGDQVMGDKTANAGFATGSGNSGNTNSNVDESALQNLNVRF